MRMKDKVAVITGAASGIGLAITKRALAEGASVVAADWNANALSAAFGGTDNRIIALPGDVSQEADCVAMIDRAVSAFGRIDVLVNNAGVMDRFQSVADVDNDTWHRCMSVNLYGPMYTMRRAVPLMLAQGGGAIINIASVAATGGGAAGAAYTASKHGLIGLTKSTAYQYARLGLRCNALAVGGVKTNIMDSVKGAPLDEAALGRLGAYHASNPGTLAPDDIANVVLFLASDEARHVNGAVLPVDMGWSAA
ncbi:NAD(P)-dependent dehydrogenase, short-chain alcohol dehydrogenase family [Devosia enhydra]|uniref:NAD(P)-dependent dehydrogenase, short-chain alcohol dehydrogenase family n=1 Tax=Devosia enhydra TaxID=665118 RepID=A0A1K2I2H2_9HYPH|nr:SDR family oxidoreductase [Devosia enhydra]SFZ86419.1 NAD(P)-dependent dehydrogenase, short-chain alcohol dehydrogenase family [Devosia enhydra]